MEINGIGIKPNINGDINGDKMDIDVDSLLYVKSFNVYQELICVQNEKQVKLLIRNTMANIEKQLSGDDQFLRCHRSYLVNTQKIKSVEGNTRQYYFVLEGPDEKIPISRTSADQMLEKFVGLLIKKSEYPFRDTRFNLINLFNKLLSRL